MGVMPALMSRMDLSFCGTSEKLGRRRCPFVSKNFRNIYRSSFRPYALCAIVKTPLTNNYDFGELLAAANAFPPREGFLADEGIGPYDLLPAFQRKILAQGKI